jgi:hypothetical protein
MHKKGKALGFLKRAFTSDRSLYFVIFMFGNFRLTAATTEAFSALLFAKSSGPDGKPVDMKNLRTENSVYLSRDKTRKLVSLLVLFTGSLLLVTAMHALSGGPTGESGERGGPREAFRGESSVRELIAGARFAGTISVASQNPDQTYASTAGELVVAVVANELTDREQLRKWICVIEKRAGKETLTEEQVETTDGPLYRLLAIDGRALNRDQRQQDDLRIGGLMKDPSPLLKLKQAQGEDELKLQKLMSLMPQAFVYDYDGVEENLLRVKFRPNPDYSPPTYEARVIHSLAGTILIDSEHKRLARVAAHLMNRVEFGYGLLGRIDSGTVELGRVEVGPQQWKTAFINIHFSGRVAIFKTISKDQYERRSEFRVVSSNLSLTDAKDLLVSRILPSPQTPKTGQ